MAFVSQKHSFVAEKLTSKRRNAVLMSDSFACGKGASASRMWVDKQS